MEAEASGWPLGKVAVWGRSRQNQNCCVGKTALDTEAESCYHKDFGKDDKAEGESMGKNAECVAKMALGLSWTAKV